MNEVKTILILIRCAPYGTASAGEGFRAVIALAGMGIRTRVVLADDGVMVARKNQQPGALGMHKLEDVYSQLADFKAKLYLHQPSLEERGISPDDCIQADVLDDDKLGELLSRADHVLSFD